MRSWHFHAPAADFLRSPERTDDEPIPFDGLARKLDADPISNSSPRLRAGEVAARIAEFAGCMVLFRFDPSHSPNGRMSVALIRRKG